MEFSGDVFYRKGWNPLQKSVILGSWERLESYAHDIIEVKL